MEDIKKTEEKIVTEETCKTESATINIKKKALINIDLIALIVVVTLGLAFLVQVGEINNEMDRLFPIFLLILIGFLSILLLIKAIVKPQTKEQFFEESNKRRVFLVMGICIVWVSLLKPLGFYLTSYIFICLLSIVLDTKMHDPKTAKLRQSLGIMGVNLIIIGVLYLVFAVLLGVRAPRGILI